MDPISKFLIRQLNQKLTKDDLKELSQEFDNNVEDLVKQKECYPDEYMSN